MLRPGASSTPDHVTTRIESGVCVPISRPFTTSVTAPTFETPITSVFASVASVEAMFTHMTNVWYKAKYLPGNEERFWSDLNGAPVPGMGDERFEVGDLLAETALRDAGGGGDAHGKRRILDLLAQPGGGVAGGGGVGHRGHAGETTGHGGARAGGASFRGGDARVAEMHMDVAESARHDEVAGGIAIGGKQFVDRHGDVFPLRVYT